MRRWPEVRLGGCSGQLRLGRPGSAPASEELIGEVPGSQLTRLQADEEVVGGPVGIDGAGLRPEVPRCDSLHRIVDADGDELAVAADLDPTVRRGVLADHDAGSWIPPPMH